MSLTVMSPGPLTTVQDRGRWGYQAWGMPVAGAMDRYAYEVANLLVGNEAGAASLEMTLKGGAFRFEDETLVALCGAEMGASLDGICLANWSSFLAPAGSLLSLDWATDGCRSYMAFGGGIDVPEIQGSRSTYARGSIGGFAGRPLKPGDKVDLRDRGGMARLRSLPSQFVPHYGNEIVLRVLPGPQDDLFDPSEIATFYGEWYEVTNEADRMGYRLSGRPLRHRAGADIVSDSVCQGAIQIPGHGMPIIMLSDRQTTGGYAKLGAVIGPDLCLLAQAKPGDRIRFIEVDDGAAVAALRDERARIDLIAKIFS